MDDVLFLIGLILLAAGLALVLLQAFVPEEAQRLHWPFPCAFYSVLHIPCLGCGATTVDLNQCIGCGLCTTRCEFDAIHLSRDLPAASEMHTAEEMMKLVGPYAIKRMGKIIKRKITGKSEYPAEQE